MNRTKKFLLVSGCLMAAGAAIALISYRFGGYLGITVGPAGTKIESSTLSEHKTTNYRLGGYHSVEIQADDADVALEPSDRTGVEISCFGDHPVPVYEVSGNTLRITQKGKKEEPAWFHVDLLQIGSPVREADQITVFLPKGATLDSIKVAGKSGNIRLTGAASQNTALTTDYGNLALNGVSGGKTSLEAKNGNVNLQKVTVASLKLNNRYGKSTLDQVKITGGEKTELSGDSGAFFLHNLEGTSVELSCSNGDISAVSVTAARFTAKLNNGDLRLENSQIGQMDITDQYGDITGAGVLARGASIQCGTGQIHLAGTFTGKTALNSKYGKVAFTSSLPIDQYRYNILAHSGGITLNGQKTGNWAHRDESAENSLDVVSESGDVSVEFQGKTEGSV